MVRYKVTLTKGERDELEAVLAKGKHSSQLYRNSCILLNCDEGGHGERLANEDIARVLQISTKTVERLRKRFVEEGFGACIQRKAYPKKGAAKADGDFEAHLIAISCSRAPEGFARWSLRMLADKMVELEHVDSVPHETVRQVLKKTRSSPGG